MSYQIIALQINGEIIIHLEDEQFTLTDKRKIVANTVPTRSIIIYFDSPAAITGRRRKV